ncbi:BQ5605_C034g11272 [Microbotryum silenes-dioicae]|uniref:BQ5605_C034g11272 protein n=1 Tax=Microbotryum silenes-dioicae TaxID=796604 RepID=A0A2X0PB03_9BASI|nr:BQ5605_C034g11272 [Microbotryum silenes-dioicae]
MPTIEEYDSDPDDMPLEPVAPTPTLAKKAKGNLGSSSRPPPSTAASSTATTAGVPGFSPMGPKKSYIAGIEGLPTQNHYQVLKKEDYTGVSKKIALEVSRGCEVGCGKRMLLGPNFDDNVCSQYPLAEIMAQACGFLGVENVYEPLRVHPQDWENPGRVKVLLKKDGKVLNPQIPTKRLLLQHLCSFLSVHLPKSKFSTTSPGEKPPLERRLPALSPAISHGVLDAALKGNGPMGAFTGGGAMEEGKEVEEAPVVAKKVPPKMPKQRRVVKRR